MRNVQEDWLANREQLHRLPHANTEIELDCFGRERHGHEGPGPQSLDQSLPRLAGTLISEIGRNAFIALNSSAAFCTLEASSRRTPIELLDRGPA
jgi:hypothetical protein